MYRFWSRLAVELGKRAGLVSVIGLLVTLILGLGITRLDFATGQDSYLNKSDQVYKDNVAYQALFGGQAMLTVITMDPGHTIDELFTAENRQQFTQMHETLAATGDYQGIITPVTVMEFSDSLVQSPDGNPATSVAGKATLTALGKETAGSPQAQARNDDNAQTLTRLTAIPFEQRTLDNPEWVKFLLYDNTGEIRKPLRSFFPDSTHAQVITRLLGNESLDEEGAAATQAKREAEKLELVSPSSERIATTVTTGASILLKDINDYLRGGMLTLGAIAVAIMVVILLVLFNVRWRLLPLGVILVGVVWAFGLAGYLGIPLTVVTIAGLPVMLGIGIDYAIQMHARVEEEVIIDRSEHPIQETSRNLGPALLVVTFDAIFAFAALRFAKVPMIRQFGLLLAVGIAAICLCSIILPLAILGIREYKSPTKGKDFREGPLGRLVVWLGSLPAACALPLIIFSLGIFFVGISVEDRLTLQTDPIQWVNQKSQVIKDIDEVEAQVHSSNEMGVYVTAPSVFTDDVVQFVHTFTADTLAKYEPSGRIATASSIETTIGDLISVPGASDIAPTGADIEAAYNVAPDDIKASTVSADHKAMNIIFRTGPGSLEDRAPMVRAVRDETHPPAGIRATPSGLAVVGVGLLDNLEANRILLTYLAILFVFLFLAVRLKSVIRALLSLVPVLIAVGLASTVAFVFGLKLSPMTAVGGPLVVAACTEFTSLILLRFIEERDRGLEPKLAVDVVASRTGRAFIVSALTAIAGVAVLSFSSLPLLRDFGRIVAMNVTVALLSALVVLPPMLVWADRRNWVSRGMLHHRHDPYIPTPRPGAAAAAEVPVGD
ncbi:MAG TPA: MMPL family transporter [Acidimicrobiales bacterium]|nr:MMPL family transporter [Acidimicrobiales bacterium]